MVKENAFTICLVFSLVLLVSSRINYKGYKLLRFIIPQGKTRLLEAIEKHGGNVWSRRHQTKQSWTVDVLCSEQKCTNLKQKFREHDAVYKELIDDIQELIDEENSLQMIVPERGRFSEKHNLTWSRYHPYSDLEGYLDYLGKTYPNVCDSVLIGKSAEGRNIKVLHVHNGNTTKPGIWIDAGIHAREWIAPATASFIGLQLVEKQKEKGAANEFNWHILPMVNPDGYEYSRTSDRFWRKSRRKYPRCVGVDLNRNFGYQWSKSHGCKDDYGGPEAFSEPESQAIRNYILSNRRIKVYISLHSYSQLWLMPWSFTKEKPLDYSELYQLANHGVNEIKNVRGTVYLVGTPPDLIYMVFGASDDWAKGEAGIKYSYTVELPDKGEYGFLLPASQIKAVGNETWVGLRAIAKGLRALL